MFSVIPKQILEEHKSFIQLPVVFFQLAADEAGLRLVLATIGRRETWAFEEVELADEGLLPSTDSSSSKFLSAY